MALAGAPTRYLGINVGTLLVGLVALALLGRATIELTNGMATLLSAFALLATALLGLRLDGAARWVSI